MRGLAQVQHDRAFVAVGINEDVTHAWVFHGAGVAHDVALRGLDLDDVGAVITQNLRGVGAQHHTGEVNHAQARECTLQQRAVVMPHA